MVPNWCALPKFNIAPEKLASQKENSNHPLAGASCYILLNFTGACIMDVYISPTVSCYWDTSCRHCYWEGGFPQSLMSSFLFNSWFWLRQYVHVASPIGLPPILLGKFGQKSYYVTHIRNRDIDTVCVFIHKMYNYYIHIYRHVSMLFWCKNFHASNTYT